MKVASRGADISLQTSHDFGATWSDARTISVTGTGAPAPRDQFFPWLSVDESGSVHAIWYDTRNDPAFRVIETFQALSTDGGDTWSQTNISTVAWDPGQSFFTCGCCRLFWYTHSSRSRVGSYASEGEMGRRAFFDGRMSCRFGLSANCPGLSIRTGSVKDTPPSSERVKNIAGSYEVVAFLDRVADVEGTGLIDHRHRPLVGRPPRPVRTRVVRHDAVCAPARR